MHSNLNRNCSWQEMHNPEEEKQQGPQKVYPQYMKNSFIWQRACSYQNKRQRGNKHSQRISSYKHREQPTAQVEAQGIKLAMILQKLQQQDFVKQLPENLTVSLSQVRQTKIRAQQTYQQEIRTVQSKKQNLLETIKILDLQNQLSQINREAAFKRNQLQKLTGAEDNAHTIEKVQSLRSTTQQIRNRIQGLLKDKSNLKQAMRENKKSRFHVCQKICKFERLIEDLNCEIFNASRTLTRALSSQAQARDSIDQQDSQRVALDRLRELLSLHKTYYRYTKGLEELKLSNSKVKQEKNAQENKKNRLKQINHQNIHLQSEMKRIQRQIKRIKGLNSQLESLDTKIKQEEDTLMNLKVELLHKKSQQLLNNNSDAPHHLVSNTQNHEDAIGIQMRPDSYQQAQFWTSQVFDSQLCVANMSNDLQILRNRRKQEFYHKSLQIQHESQKKQVSVKHCSNETVGRGLQSRQSRCIVTLIVAFLVLFFTLTISSIKK